MDFEWVELRTVEWTTNFYQSEMEGIGDWDGRSINPRLMESNVMLSKVQA
jgi:hypothetical protein